MLQYYFYSFVYTNIKQATQFLEMLIMNMAQVNHSHVFVSSHSVQRVLGSLRVMFI